jgi:hypothetical protein
MKSECIKCKKVKSELGRPIHCNPKIRWEKDGLICKNCFFRYSNLEYKLQRSNYLLSKWNEE